MASRVVLLAALIALVGCKPKPPPPAIRAADFSGERAFRDVQQLVAFGPHPSGSAALTNAAAYITAQLQAAGLTVEEQVFKAGTPRGPVEFRNIIGKTRHGHGGAGQVIVLGSHYDTKFFPDRNFVGANDGGSSTGVLLELARAAAGQTDLWFVFFDGEEAVVDYGPEDGLTGSRFFVEQLKADGHTGWVKALILFDMVGDANLNISLPSGSTPELVQQVFVAARAAGTRDSFAYRQSDILDDHTPFLQAVIPAVDLIDFEYGSAPGLNDYWHTEKDTLDKLSPLSLEKVGRTGLKLVELLRASP